MAGHGRIAKSLPAGYTFISRATPTTIAVTSLFILIDSNQRRP